MKNVNLVNKEVIEALDAMKDMWWSDIDRMKRVVDLQCDEFDRDEMISEKHLKHIMDLGTNHDGFPIAANGYSLRLEGNKLFTEHNRNFDPDLIRDLEEFSEEYNEHNERLQTILATQRNALAYVYPPGGFISWHNNQNAAAYNLICTWSENGNGWWKHYDPYEGKVVTVPDKPGWQVKAFYFGSYRDDFNDLVYHAASTDCWRFTCSYTFNEHSKDFWEDVIEEMEYDD